MISIRPPIPRWRTSPLVDFVDTDENAMIGGFIMGGNGRRERAGGAPRHRAIAERIWNSEALQDPVLELRDSSGSTLVRATIIGRVRSRQRLKRRGWRQRTRRNL